MSHEIISVSDCQKFHSRKLHPTQICTGKDGAYQTECYDKYHKVKIKLYDQIGINSALVS